MNVIFSIDFAGTPDSDDVLAARHAIFLENKTRSERTPPGTPLPFSTPAQVKSSYLTILAAITTKFHQEAAAYAKTGPGVNQRFTLTQVAQINANLVARLNAGEAAAAIVIDTAA